MKSLAALSLIALLLCLASLQPYSSSASDSRRQIKLSIRFTDGVADSNSALWVKNLSTRTTTVALESRSRPTQEFSTSSESIVGGEIVRLDRSSLEVLGSHNGLLLRSDERIAAIVAPAELPIEQSEFYYYQQQGNTETASAPKWVIDLGAVGKSGANVLEANTAGYAPAVTTKSESGKRYLFGVGIALKQANSSAEIKLVNKEGQVIKSLEVTGPSRLHWRTDFGEFISGAGDFPGRIEMNVLTGKAQGFLSIRDLDTDELIVLPIAPTGKRSKGIRAMAGGPYGGGYASFTSFYSCPFSPYSFVVTDAPPNTCGTLKLLRNGVFESASNWICTDSNGYAVKGPWSVSKTETGQSVRIEWPDGSRTFGGDMHIDDNTTPNIWSNQNPGIGVPIPNSFSGSGSDAQWGTGFKFGPGGWSYLYATFRNVTTGLYWNGSCYCSSAKVNFDATSSPPAGGFNINWSVASPPPSAHNQYDTYEWCIRSKDGCSPCFNCIYFYGPR